MKRKIDILIADDISETRENIKRFLGFERDIQIVGEAANGEQAISMAEKMKPDIILIDINMPLVDGISAIESLSLKAPQVAPIVISVQGEAEYFKKAMRAGARDYLVKPFSGDELISTIKEVVQKEEEVREKQMNEALLRSGIKHKPRIFSVFSAKGGTGKTTLAANLASCLSKFHDKKTVIVDLDLQFGDIPIMFNITPQQTITDLLSNINELDSETLENVLIHHEETGVKLLCPPKNPEEAEYVSDEHVEEILRVLTETYEYILVDTPPAFSGHVLSALDQSHKIFLVTTLDLPSIKNAKNSINIMDNLGYPEDKVNLVVNKEDKYYQVGKQDLQDALNRGIFYRMPNKEKPIVEAINRGVPVILEPSVNGVVSEFRKFSNKVIEHEKRVE
ncbi:response regulator [Natranaerobius thermophilus]|uniref:Stage 0 sporulation protein A homolog n=1 Tax=Natranaerobius thermophilus (strain ATCC BAA-1301 / DSM 18059 / JW/NM-WN-LF) TaxID=457570 RepID=B2A8J8_NATTJ|nr:response regulator [Natranaerobius thermophilus]ACB85882.1 response regulator receiver protein [Natranaerobius thermophilus JW/NM-WN-LF]